jgi:uncharacterized protein (TIGR03083 family)
VDYTAALLEQNQLLAELTHPADPATPVPSCPEWTLKQLITHVGRGDRWAAKMVRDRADAAADLRSVPDGKPPEDPDGAKEWLLQSARTLVEAVAETGPDTPVWTFVGPRPSGWWVRRRLHEATVHRADAAIALGAGYELSAPLAADGVSEWLAIWHGRHVPGRPAALDPGVTLHLHATDGDLGSEGEWLIRGEDGAVSWEHGHGKGDAAVRGRAADLLLAVLRRPLADPDAIEVIGDAKTWQLWLERTPF